MTELSKYYSIILTTADKHSIKYIDKTCGNYNNDGTDILDITIFITDDIKLSFKKMESKEYCTDLLCLIITEESEVDFDIKDYTNKTIYEIKQRYNLNPLLLNYIRSIQKKLNLIPKDYIDYGNHRFINGSMVY